MVKAICLCLLIVFLTGCFGIDSTKFPWPPPQPSAFEVIPETFLKKTIEKTSVGEVAKRLEHVLDEAGYSEKVWFYARDGFVVMTRLEQVDPDTGKPLKGGLRWQKDIAPPKDLASYFKGIIYPKEGHFRIIVFAFTTQKCHIDVFPEVKHIDLKKWFSRGVINGISEKVKNLPYLKYHSCVALIYEFRKFPGRDELVLKNKSNFPGRKHLESTRIWKNLKSGEKEK